MYGCLEMVKCCFLCEFCKILNSNVQEGSLWLELVAYDRYAHRKGDFPRFLQL